MIEINKQFFEELHHTYMSKRMIDDVLEMYYNETDDYDEIADRLNVSVLDVAYIVNQDTL